MFRFRPVAPPVLKFCFAALLAGLPACQRHDPATLRVVGNDAGGLARWRYSVREAFTREEWREFDDALQDIRLGITAEGSASGSAAVEMALLQRIGGKTRREVVRLSAEARFRRLARLRDELKEMIDGNALMVARPGDPDSARKLQQFSAAQQQCLRDLEGQLAAARDRAAALGGEVSPAPVTSADPGKPANFSRSEARAQIEQFLAARRAQAQLRFGAWPLKIDAEGRELEDEQRSDFLARQAAAATNGHTVAAVRIKGRWWLHDAPIPPLDVSAAVNANLTPDDRAALAAKWKTLSLEIWARTTARQAEEAELEGQESEVRASPVTAPARPPQLPRP